jgi:hypothetical protein
MVMRSCNNGELNSGENIGKIKSRGWLGSIKGRIHHLTAKAEN